jgi:hypothetical protein
MRHPQRKTVQPAWKKCFLQRRALNVGSLWTHLRRPCGLRYWAQRYTRCRSFQNRLEFVLPILQFEDALLVSWHLGHDRLSRLGPPNVVAARFLSIRDQHILPICWKIRVARDPSHICHRSKTPISLSSPVDLDSSYTQLCLPVRCSARCDLIQPEALTDTSNGTNTSNGSY